MDKKVLKACPFCGDSDAEIYKGSHYHDDGDWIIECGCGGKFHGNTVKGLTIDMWNTRLSKFCSLPTEQTEGDILNCPRCNGYPLIAQGGKTVSCCNAKCDLFSYSMSFLVWNKMIYHGKGERGKTPTEQTEKGGE